MRMDRRQLNVNANNGSGSAAEIRLCHASDVQGEAIEKHRAYVGTFGAER